MMVCNLTIRPKIFLLTYNPIKACPKAASGSAVNCLKLLHLGPFLSLAVKPSVII